MRKHVKNLDHHIKTILKFLLKGDFNLNLWNTAILIIYVRSSFKQFDLNVKF